MRLNRVIAVAFCLMVGVAYVWAAQAPTSATATEPAPTATTSPAKIQFKNDQEKISYAVGCWLGNNLKNDETTVDIPLLVQGLTDILKGQPRSLDDQEVQQAMALMQKDVQAKMEKKRQELAEKNKADGKAFLDANAKKEGVKVLPDGLQYKVIKEGTGNTPTATDTTKVKYRGSFIDGKKFEDPNEPATIQLARVIKGWNEALQLMKEGSKWELYIPSDLAYGDPGRGPIPPGSTLVFEVELLEIVKAAAPAPGAAAPGATNPVIRPVPTPSPRPQ